MGLFVWWHTFHSPILNVIDVVIWELLGSETGSLVNNQEPHRKAINRVEKATTPHNTPNRERFPKDLQHITHHGTDDFRSDGLHYIRPANKGNWLLGNIIFVMPAFGRSPLQIDNGDYLSWIIIVLFNGKCQTVFKIKVYTTLRMYMRTFSASSSFYYISY